MAVITTTKYWIEAQSRGGGNWFAWTDGVQLEETKRHMHRLREDYEYGGYYRFRIVIEKTSREIIS